MSFYILNLLMLQMWGRNLSLGAAAGVDEAAMPWICDRRWVPVLVLLLHWTRAVNGPGLWARVGSLPLLCLCGQWDPSHPW